MGLFVRVLIVLDQIKLIQIYIRYQMKQQKCIIERLIEEAE